MLNIVIAENRTLEFHIHDESDEMFYVIEGKMQIKPENAIFYINKRWRSVTCLMRFAYMK